MSRVEVIAPQLPAFIRIHGNAMQRHLVEHICFRGLSFQYSCFELPPGNSNGAQGSTSVAAAVTLTGARQCRFDQCEFRNLGTWAIEAGRGCAENSFTGNEVALGFQPIDLSTAGPRTPTGPPSAAHAR